jgi:hypothetical protein
MRNSIVYVLRETMTHFLSYLCSISCIDVNPLFDTVVLASQEGVVLVCSLTKGAVRSSFDVPDKHPMIIKLTKSWGVIVILSADRYRSKYWISSYSNEGELLREIQLSHCPTTLSVFTSGSGFDYIAYANENLAVYVVDAVRGAPDAAVYTAPAKVVSLSYDVRKRLFVVVTAGGAVKTINTAWE